MEKEFSKAYNKTFELIAKSKLSLSEYRVFVYMVGILSKGNLINLSQAQIARDLKMDKGNVSRTYKKLIEKNILIRNDNTSHTYINSSLISFYADSNTHAAKAMKLEDYNPPIGFVGRNKSGKNKSKEKHLNG